MALGIYLIAAAILFAFRAGILLESDERIGAIWFVVSSVICAVFGILVLGGII